MLRVSTRTTHTHASATCALSTIYITLEITRVPARLASFKAQWALEGVVFLFKVYARFKEHFRGRRMMSALQGTIDCTATRYPRPSPYRIEPQVSQG